MLVGFYFCIYCININNAMLEFKKKIYKMINIKVYTIFVYLVNKGKLQFCRTIQSEPNRIALRQFAFLFRSKSWSRSGHNIMTTIR